MQKHYSHRFIFTIAVVSVSLLHVLPPYLPQQQQCGPADLLSLCQQRHTLESFGYVLCRCRGWANNFVSNCNVSCSLIGKVGWGMRREGSG